MYVFSTYEYYQLITDLKRPYITKLIILVEIMCTTRECRSC